MEIKTSQSFFLVIPCTQRITLTKAKPLSKANILMFATSGTDGLFSKDFVLKTKFFTELKLTE